MGLICIWDTDHDLIKWKDKSFWPWPRWLAILDRPHPEAELSRENPETQIILASLIHRIIAMSFPVLEPYKTELKEIAFNLVQPL